MPIKALFLDRLRELAGKMANFGEKTPLFAGSEAAGPEQRRGRIELMERLTQTAWPVNPFFAKITLFG
jgi:hypothetical protein